MIKKSEILGEVMDADLSGRKPGQRRRYAKYALVLTGVLLAVSVITGFRGVPQPVRVGIVAVGTLIVWGLLIRRWQAGRPGGGR